MIPQNSNIFCIIVHFGAKKLTDALIKQLSSGKTLPTACIIVNHTKEMYRPPTSPIELHTVHAGGNGGYAAGINRGLALLARLNLKSQDVVLVCNNDVSIDVSTLSKLRMWWQQQTDSILAAHRLGYVNLLTGRAYVTSIDAANTPFAIPYAHGSCLTARYATWKHLGRLPEQYFLYWEDIALSMRAHATDVSLRQLPEMGITHDDMKKPASVRKRYLLVRNGAAVLETHLPGMWPLYWRGINRLRLAYHHFRGHQAVFQALTDRKNV